MDFQIYTVYSTINKILEICLVGQTIQYSTIFLFSLDMRDTGLALLLWKKFSFILRYEI